MGHASDSGTWVYSTWALTGNATRLLSALTTCHHISASLGAKIIVKAKVKG